MGFFDKITDIVSSTSKELNKKAKDLVSTNKLEGQITQEEERIQSAYAQIGEAYYNAHKDEADGQFVQLCQEITQAYRSIEDLKKELEKLKGLQRCPNCGASVSIEASFCPSCGAKMPEAMPEAEEEPADVVEDLKEKASEVVEEVKEKAEEIKEKVEDKIDDLTD